MLRGIPLQLRRALAFRLFINCFACALIIALLMIQVASASSNVARGQPATQSTSPWAHDATAGLAVDGNTNCQWDGHSVASTDEHRGWWQVDLGAVYDIDYIKIWNRTDCCKARLQGFRILIDGKEFGGGLQSLDGAVSKEFRSTTNTRGRVVKIQMYRNVPEESYLSLAEVEVYGTPAAGATPATSAASRFVVCEGAYDTTTGLCWERTPSVSRFTWQGATEFCAAKGGATGWRS